MNCLMCGAQTKINPTKDYISISCPNHHNIGIDNYHVILSSGTLSLVFANGKWFCMIGFKSNKVPDDANPLEFFNSLILFQ